MNLSILHEKLLYWGFLWSIYFTFRRIFKRGKESYIPMLTDFKLSKVDLEEQAWSESKWDDLRENLVNSRSDAISDEIRFSSV